MNVIKLFLLCVVGFSWAADFSTLPDNTWSRITDAPGDALGRDVPPGRGSTWAYSPLSSTFFRFGGYTPTFTNALDEFNPVAKSWTRLFAHDENYPTDRPGGGSSWMIAYDSARSLFWLAGGKSTTPTGNLGIWSYNPVSKVFASVGSALRYSAYYVFDSKNGLIVASPGLTCYGAPSGQTDVFDVATGKWEAKTGSTMPQSCYSGNYPMVYDPSISRIVLLAGADTWHYDAGGNLWEKVTTTGTPPSAKMPALAYDPLNQVVIRYGGSDGRNVGSYINETWVYKGATRTWTKLSCPGIPTHAQSKQNQPLFYHQAIDYYPTGHCFLMSDPDLGVWAFRYNPATSMGTTVLDAESLIVGKAAKNTAAAGPADVLRTFPSALNPRFANLNDNTMVTVPAGCFTGDEVSWHYDAENGIILKYGGCGNGSNPYYGGYGSSMGIFDPGSETWLTRRVSDPSGMNRPGTGCTRSAFYDSKRKKWWFFGNISGEPYPCFPPDMVGPYSYDLKSDLFTDNKVATQNHGGTNLTYDPVHDISIKPDSAFVHIFMCDSMKWKTLPVQGGPGRIDGYASTEWVPTLNAFMTFRKGKTWAYYPDSNKWVDLNPPNPPPARECKFGFAYDSQNDIVLLMGGYVVWNENPINDLWVYHPSTNTWEQMHPTATGVNLDSQLGVQMTAYDSRHNVFFIGIECGRGMFAYRYKNNGSRAEQERKNGPKQFKVSPNPFNPSTHIILPGNSMTATLKVFNAAGRLVADLSPNAAGQESFKWRADGLSSGVYFLLYVDKGKRWKTSALLYR